jgi:uncharacterized protein
MVQWVMKVRPAYFIMWLFVTAASSEHNSSCNDSLKQFILNAHEQTKITRYYDLSYVKLTYPGGDVSPEKGVCTDVIIRAFRSVGIDLQKLIHDDMVQYFNEYPKKWGLKKPDSNIDHRRVPNIVTYLKRKGKAIEITDNGDDYQPGDIVTWNLGDMVDHIGLVSDIVAKSGAHYKMIHNIGRGTELEDMLFSYEITAHFRYFCNEKK